MSSKRIELLDGIQSPTSDPISLTSRVHLDVVTTGIDDFSDDEFVPKKWLPTGGGGGSEIPPVIFSVNAGDPNPFFIDITLYIDFDENSTFIYRIDNGDGTWTRFMDQTIVELYTGATFNGFNFMGHDDGTGNFAEDCQIVMIAHPSTPTT